MQRGKNDDDDIRRLISDLRILQNWDKELEKHAADLTTHCRLASIAQRPRNARYARGVTGYTKKPGGGGVADELQKIYFQDSNSSVYWQVCFHSANQRVYLQLYSSSVIHDQVCLFFLVV